MTTSQPKYIRNYSITGKLAGWAFSPQADENRIVRFLRSGARILVIIFQEFIDTHITLRASALTFTIILSLVPLLAMSTAILKGLGSGDQLQTIAYRLIDQLDPNQETVRRLPPQHPKSASSAEEAVIPETDATGSPGSEGSLNSHLHDTIDTIFQYVDNTNFAALGAFGIAGLLIAVILVFSSMEDAMNSIWHTRRGRSLFRKIMDYLALLVLLPISINIAIAGDAILESPKIMGYINTVIPSEWVVQMLFTLLPFVFITLSLMMMYLFFPHVKVKTLPALCGAVFASIFWFIVQRAYIILQIGVAKYNAIYGSFATVPLLLIWIQLGWTFILLGAVLAYAIQNRNQYQLPETGSKPEQALQCAFDVLLTVYSGFAKGSPVNTQQLSTRMAGENLDGLGQTINLLVDGELLLKSEINGTERLTPARPAALVSAEEVVHLVLADDQPGNSPGAAFARRVITAAEQAVSPEEFPGRAETQSNTQPDSAAGSPA